MSEKPESNCFVKSYLGEIVAWRIVAAIFWSIICQCSIVITLRILFAVDIDFWHPTSWVQNIVRTPLYLIPLAAIILAHGLILSKSINSNENIYNKFSRFEAVSNILTIHSLLLGIVHICTGGLFFWLYLHLVGGLHSQFSSKCKDVVNSNCLVESHLYLILCGIWIGIFLFMKNYVIASKTVGLLNFPSVQQRKFCHVMTELVPTLKKSFYDSMLPSTLFVLVYFWLGDSVRELCCEFFNLKFDANVPLTYLLSISNATLLIYSLALSSLYIFSINMLELLLKVCLMQHITFPIAATFGNINCVTLCQVLMIKEIRIMYHLGYLDLMLLAGTDRGRREELFSLSQPGGHPYNWNALLDECLKLINTFTADLNMANNEYLMVSEISTSTKKTSLSFAANKTVGTSMPGLRNLSMRQVVDMNQSSTNVSSRMRCTKVDSVEEMKSQVNRLKQKLIKNSAFLFLFGELPEKRLRHILVSKGQLVIWATQSLALLASASFEEDNYGVVQKDLPAIITALLQLKKILDKLQKTGSYKKPNKNDKFDIKLKNSLRSAVKRSLYRITVTFGHYIKELPISNDALLQIQNFLALKEG